MYIGKTTKTLEQRKQQHYADSKRHEKYAFYRAIKKYGFDNIRWEIIDNASDESELSKKEKYWINFYNTYIHLDNSCGYNTTLGGEGTSGLKYSEDAKRKLSENRIGEKNGFYNKKHNLYSRAKISKSKINKYNGINNPNYGNKWNEEQKQFISNLNKGRLTGESNPSVIITEDIAKEIKIKLSNGELISVISNDLHISYDIVRNIKLLKCWKELLPELNEDILNFKQKRTKLDLEKAKEIKIRLSNGDNSIDIINDLQVTKDNVFNIKYLKNYKNLLPELNEILISKY